MAEKPLILKDYLELDWISEPFRLAPPKQPAGTTLRSLLDTELRGGGFAGHQGPSFHVRSYSKTALTKLSDLIKAVNGLRFFTAGSKNPASTSLLLKSFSRNLRCGLWERSGGEKERGLRSVIEEEVETNSVFSTSPVVSSCMSSSDGGDSTSSDFLLSYGVGASSHRASPDRRELKENRGKAMDCPMEEEKEQLSPVSVMEFPYKDEVEEEEEDEVEQLQPSTTSFSSPLHETTTNQLRPFVEQAEQDNFESTVPLPYEDEEEQRRKAFSLLHHVAGCQPLPAIEENLLFEFFLEALSLSGRRRSWRSVGEEELVRMAAGWVSGEMGAVEDGAEVVVGEMEMAGGWRGFEEDVEMVAAEISCGLMTGLMEDLAAELSLAA
ncbi:uncharacterized protein LOC110019186 isoform X2 [Phalaenopsis equestris]|uniref:uncharacterized protein LOC110019186 isoform X2 n=1 Tax=Phalaenopsis equestris TaxID=78828 RepID=UPI0009E54ADA|nr:uncharacterized protein LOC110019186 isoform X2 [Phalaenopsis equestris]